MKLSYKTKYYIALGVAIVGGLGIAMGAAALSRSFGNAETIRDGLTKLIVGFVLFAPSAPAVYYYKSRKNQPADQTQLEVQALLTKQEQDKKISKNN